jgi:hypothetical protein
MLRAIYRKADVDIEVAEMGWGYRVLRLGKCFCNDLRAEIKTSILLLFMSIVGVVRRWK